MKKLTSIVAISAFLVTLCGPLSQGINAAYAQTPSSSSLTEQPKEPHFAHGGWVMEGVGAVVVVAGTVLLALGYGSFSDAEQLREDNPGGEKNDEANSIDSTGTALTAAGWIALGVGIATLAGGSIWLIAKRTKKANSSKTSGTASLPPAPKTPQRGTVFFTTP